MEWFFYFSFFRLTAIIIVIKINNESFSHVHKCHRQQNQMKRNKKKQTNQQQIHLTHNQKKKIWCKLNHRFIIRYKWNLYTMLRVRTYNCYFDNSINVLIIISATKNDKATEDAQRKWKQSNLDNINKTHQVSYLLHFKWIETSSESTHQLIIIICFWFHFFSCVLAAITQMIIHHQ